MIPAYVLFLHVPCSYPDLARLAPFASFMDADYFLTLRYLFTNAEMRSVVDWLPGSTLYMRHPPRFLLEAARVESARRIARALGLKDGDVDRLRTQLTEHATWHEALFGNGWRSPMRRFDVRTISSK